MFRSDRSRRTKHRRAGKILVMFAFLLPVMLGLTGLVIDGGLLMAAHREAYNAADAAALAAAMDKYLGASDQVALDTANDFLRQNSPTAYLLALNNGEVDALNIPPIQGPHAGDPQYVEAITRRPVTTLFMQVLGVNPEREVVARAVAGYEAVSSGEGAIVLDPRATPQQGGLRVTGGGRLVVEGAVIVNSQGKGVDQYGGDVDSIYNQYAVHATNNSSVFAGNMFVAGGVNDLTNIHHIDYYPNPTPEDGNRPLWAGTRQYVDDPLKDLEVPEVSVAGQAIDGSGTLVTPNSMSNGKPAFTVGQGETRVFQPGVYADIRINNGANVEFEPGIYVLSPNGNNQGLYISGAPTVIGNDVMFYFTGSNYLSTDPPGYYDRIDNTEMNLQTNQIPGPPDPLFNQVNFARLQINTTGGTVEFTGFGNDESALPGADSYDNMLFYFRRRIGVSDNTNYASIAGNAGQDVYLNGTIYGKWLTFALSGGGRYDAQFIVGGLAISGQADITLLSTGRDFGLANQVFLVE